MDTPIKVEYTVDFTEDGYPQSNKFKVHWVIKLIIWHLWLTSESGYQNPTQVFMAIIL